jgi:hypothetical protein
MKQKPGHGQRINWIETAQARTILTYQMLALLKLTLAYIRISLLKAAHSPLQSKLPRLVKSQIYSLPFNRN